ncbi:hypothetical protein LBMAG15_01260 [Actinomycetes bacterium]|nr:hypothetical protein LBMAG15_01260 [Actinomycetes bacterium]
MGLADLGGAIGVTEAIQKPVIPPLWRMSRARDTGGANAAGTCVSY